jgi:hypothetical protein
MNRTVLSAIAVCLLLAGAASPVSAQWSTDTGVVWTNNRAGINSSAAGAQLYVYNSPSFPVFWAAARTGGWLKLSDTVDTEGYCCGLLAEFFGNSLLRISNLQIGFSGYPLIQALSGSTLYLNTQQGGEVLVGHPAYATGLSSRGTGPSYFGGTLGVGTPAPVAALDVRIAPNNAYAGLLVNSSNHSYLRAASATAGDVHLGDLITRNVLLGENGGVKVGIGTPNPAQALSVNGTVESTGGGFKFPDGTTQATAFAPSAAGVVSVSAAAPQYQLQSTSGQRSTISTGNGTSIDVFGAATPANNTIVFHTSNVANSTSAEVEAMRITNTGVTIAGNVTVTGDLSAHTVTGAVYASSQDVAEWVPATTQMDDGTVVVLNPARNNEVMLSEHAYDTTVAGVVSPNPGVLLGVGDASKAKIATTGRVKVHADASRGGIRIGDLLVTSDRPGVAMRSEPIDVAGVKIHRPGTIIGKALEPLPSGAGDILVLLSLQ